MDTIEAPGLSAAWLNGWLAALGITILVPGTTLRWAGDPRPSAILQAPNLIEQLVNVFPTIDDLKALAIARQSPTAPIEFTRKVSTEAYTSRAGLARAGDHSLAATVTDLAPSEEERIAHSPFDPSAPKGLTIHQRLASCREAITDIEPRLLGSLNGNGERAQMNGLGFDYSRLFAPTIPSGQVWCDPVIEILAFYGLSYIPVRGDGQRIRTRGWEGPATRRGSFTWPTWAPALNTSAIDALLDRFWSGGERHIAAAAFRSVAYQPRGSLDATRAFASERMP